MLNKVRKYISQNDLLKHGKLYLVALSGGADSVCLLLILKELGYEVHAVHCNFHLRDSESDRDETFCRELCERQNVPLHISHFDTKTYAQLHKMSIEMAARELRYGYFEQLRDAINAESIVVAHHKNDNVETLFINLIRGTGISGLTAMKPRNGRIIRPLLCVTRAEILQFLKDREQDYVTDSSNLKNDVVRNKIRLDVMPILEGINPSVVENISRSIENLSEITKIVDKSIENSMEICCKEKQKRHVVDVNELKKKIVPEEILFRYLSKFNFSPAQVKSIYENIDSTSGRTWSSGTHILAKDREKLIIMSAVESAKYSNIELRIPEEGQYHVLEGEKIDIRRTTRTTSFSPSKQKYLITIDSDKVVFPLTLRCFKEGDTFMPFGMKGKKLISDYMTDRKRDYFQRKHQLVLTDANGNIIWLLGERVSQLVACNDNTINRLSVRYVINED